MMHQRKRIGDILVESGLISEQQLQDALQKQKNSGMKLGDLLIHYGYITEQQKIEVLEFQLGIPHVQLFRQKIDEKVAQMIPESMAKKYLVLPMRIENNKLIVAMADPLDYYAIDDLQLVTGFPISPVIATKDEIQRAIHRYYGLHSSVDDILQELPLELDEKEAQEAEGPIVRLVNMIISSAVQQEASDIHLDPGEHKLLVRYRVDGTLRTERELPSSMHRVISTRLKIMGNLNIAEKRIPQDGRFELEVNFKKIDVRISTLPTIHGEKVVLRILDVQNAIKKISELGFSQANEEKFRKIITSPYGIVLITGPTGSGKTTTLYSALNKLNSEEVNIITIEDPVEYQLDGINQVQVNPAADLTFANGLRSILRQDPNIIMVGEIRDAETAEIAIRAALTGHLVLSTLHTNDAISSLTRLIDMGIAPYLVSSSIVGIVAQRLVRRICPDCKTEIEPTAEEKALFTQLGLSPTHVYKGTGCGSCNRTGFRGRVAIHEVLLIDDALREMITQGASLSAIRQYAESKGFSTMMHEGIEKVLGGQTTVAEVLSATME